MFGRRYLTVAFAYLIPLFVAHLRADSVLNFPRATFAQNQFTGYAIANPTDTDAEVTITAYRSDGTVFTSPSVTNPAKLSIGAHRQRAFLLSDSDIFGAPATLINSSDPVRLWIQASTPVTGLTGFYLLGDTSLQTLDGSDPSSGLTDALFLLLDEGTGISTDLKIVNPGDGARQYHRRVPSQ
ncbi:MAG TPA: hypothetical protein VGQ81_00310 [Acidobacteriota bacterium]|jgi:hypothetical protein|nr:hypothetical protein [Acidobacteriota bacterium]